MNKVDEVKECVDYEFELTLVDIERLLNNIRIDYTIKEYLLNKIKEIIIYHSNTLQDELEDILSR